MKDDRDSDVAQNVASLLLFIFSYNVMWNIRMSYQFTETHTHIIISDLHVNMIKELSSTFQTLMSNVTFWNNKQKHV